MQTDNDVRKEEENNYQDGLSWHQYFMEMAALVARKSKDRSTKVGAVLVGEGNTVLGVGYNGMPRKVNELYQERHLRPVKLLVTEHAERNCIYNAARHGIKTSGARMYISGNGHPCSDCARGIIQSGIVEIITGCGEFEGKGDWKQSIEIAEQMFKEAGVKLTFLDENFKETV